MTAQKEFSRIEQFIRNALKEGEDNGSKVVEDASDQIAKNISLVRQMLFVATREEMARREAIQKLGDSLRIPTLEDLRGRHDRDNFASCELDDGSAWRYLDTQDVESNKDAIERHRAEHHEDHMRDMLVNIATFESKRLFCLQCGIDV
jgi:hypothetical protein